MESTTWIVVGVSDDEDFDMLWFGFGCVCCGVKSGDVGKKVSGKEEKECVEGTEDQKS